MDELAFVKHRHSGLLILATLLIAVHITLVMRAGDLESFNLGLIVWVAVISQLRDRPEPLQIGSDRTSTIIGSLLIVPVMLKVTQLSSAGVFLHLLPFFCALGFTIIAVGRSHLIKYWKELGMVAVLAIPGEKALSRLLEMLLMAVSQEDLATLTARFATTTLNVFGFQVSLQGTEIFLANTVVHVDEGCSGARGMDFLLRLALVALLMFSAQRLQRIIIPLSAIVISFFVNGIRATIMSVLANQGNMEAFDYWHIGDGSQIFGAAAVLLFVGICYVCLKLQRQQSPPIPSD
ncbi:MAG: cyanoexosortase A [Cyanobacteria bacterium P01_F01_bin.150]